MRRKSSRYYTTAFIVTGGLIIFFGSTMNIKGNTESYMGNTLPSDGTPQLILQNKVGDDTTPHIHQTWCQLLPYKRHLQDDRVFCYVETIDDWMVE